MWQNQLCDCTFCSSKAKCPLQQQSWLEQTVAAAVEKHLAKMVQPQPQPQQVANILSKFNIFFNIQFT